MMVDAVAHFGRIDILVKNAGVGDNIHVATNADERGCLAIILLNMLLLAWQKTSPLTTAHKIFVAMPLRQVT